MNRLSEYRPSPTAIPEPALPEPWSMPAMLSAAPPVVCAACTPRASRESPASPPAPGAPQEEARTTASTSTTSPGPARLAGLILPGAPTTRRSGPAEDRQGRRKRVRKRRTGLPGRGVRFPIRRGDPRAPFEERGSPVVQLTFAQSLREVLLLPRVLAEVEYLVGLVAVVVDVLLRALQACQARLFAPAAEVQGAVRGHGEHGTARVLGVLYLVPQQVSDGRQYVELADRFPDPAALRETLRVDDEQGYPQSLLVDGIVVLVEAVLAEAFAVVAVDDEDGVVVKAEPLVLVEEVLEEEVDVADAVLVAVERVVLGKVLDAVALRGTVVMVGGDGLVGGEERLVAVRPQPLLARLEHDVVLVAEVVGLPKALRVHRLHRVELAVAHVFHELRAPLEGLDRGREVHGAVPLVPE